MTGRLEILHTELKPIKTISQIKINSECIFSLTSEFSSEKIHSESEGMDFYLADGFNRFYLDHKARFMCTSDIGRLQRLSNHQLLDVLQTSKPDSGANHWFRARQIDLAPISSDAIGVVFLLRDNCTQEAFWKSVSTCHVQVISLTGRLAGDIICFNLM